MQLELLDDQPDGGTAVGDLLTPREVATRCKVSTKTVLRAIRGGRLRASRLGRAVRTACGRRIWQPGSTPAR